MKSLLFILFIVLSFHSSYGQIDGLYGSDIRLFKGDSWELAQAVKQQNVKKIKQLVSQGKVNVNLQEPRFGKTLLIWAVLTDRYKSVQALLESGADPEIRDTYSGTSALMEAADKSETSEYVKLLLKYGANPNIDADAIEPNRVATPLIAAAGNRFESVKLLVEAGADINYVTRHNGSALRAALNGQDVDIVMYLLIVKGAKHDLTFGDKSDGSEIKIMHKLRNWTFPLDSEMYKKKMEIVAFLQERGMDYWKAPVPKHYYSIYPKEYLEKY
ncbi:ankyrin repeat domain-containing protein [Pontibacter virosus]|uniref:ankyrin repeat domain-containing protein n=1 Tax=Pontibacter virosus TaxID=1765052 RepID=UPI001FAEBD3C|nr:ankyrin repeat domain-containing protein [Pontibacter virosus]